MTRPSIIGVVGVVTGFRNTLSVMAGPDGATATAGENPELARPSGAGSPLVQVSQSLSHPPKIRETPSARNSMLNPGPAAAQFTGHDQPVEIKSVEWSMTGTGQTALATRRQIPLKLAWALSIHKSQVQHLLRLCDAVPLARHIIRALTYDAQGLSISHVRVRLDNIFERGQARRNA